MFFSCVLLLSLAVRSSAPADDTRLIVRVQALLYLTIISHTIAAVKGFFQIFLKSHNFNAAFHPESSFFTKKRFCLTFSHDFSGKIGTLSTF